MTFTEKDELLKDTVKRILATLCSPKFKIIPTNRTTLAIYRQDRCTFINSIKVKLTSNYIDSREEEDGFMIEADIMGTRYATHVDGADAVKLFKEAYARAKEDCGNDDFTFILNDFVK